MSLRIGQLEVTLSKIPKCVMHKIDHLRYYLSNYSFINYLGFSVRAIFYDGGKEAEFNEQHKKRFPPGSYEVFRHTKTI